MNTNLSSLTIIVLTALSMNVAIASPLDSFQSGIYSRTTKCSGHSLADKAFAKIFGFKIGEIEHAVVRLEISPDFFAVAPTKPGSDEALSPYLTLPVVGCFAPIPAGSETQTDCVIKSSDKELKIATEYVDDQSKKSRKIEYKISQKNNVQLQIKDKNDGITCASIYEKQN